MNYSLPLYFNMINLRKIVPTEWHSISSGI